MLLTACYRKGGARPSFAKMRRDRRGDDPFLGSSTVCVTFEVKEGEKRRNEEKILVNVKLLLKRRCGVRNDGVEKSP